MRRLSELLDAKRAIENELAPTLAEYAKRRVAVVRSGKQVTGPLDEVVAIDPQTRASLLRREQVAAQHRECDEAAMRDGRTQALLNA
jgi:hypothetical protein